jgi:VanZ family protein
MKFFEFGLFILALTVICIGCLLPARWLPPIRHDKWMHFVAFAGLSVLLIPLTNTQTELMLCFAGLFVLGFLIEILQQWIPGRRFCWRDLVANAAGIAAIAVPSFFKIY